MQLGLPTHNPELTLPIAAAAGAFSGIPEAMSVTPFQVSVFSAGYNILLVRQKDITRMFEPFCLQPGQLRGLAALALMRGLLLLFLVFS